MQTIIDADYGHPASALGLADFFAAMYFRILRHDPADPAWAERDRLVVSCGHVSAIVYAALAHAGYFDRELLKTYAELDSALQGHPVRNCLPGIEATTGSLGQGVSMAVGMALAARARKQSHTVYLLTSDGEQQEGQVWEALLAINKYQLNNLMLFVDSNGIQNSSRTDKVMPLGSLAQKYQAFGLNVMEVDGNDASQILAANQMAKTAARPTVIVMHTVPGKGVDFMENDPAWHGDAPNAVQAEIAMRQLCR